MRIISGRAKGRRLLTPAKVRERNSNLLIRPTADRAREALFSIIGSEIKKAAVLDLFAGTGALGLEALSRGADRAVFIDNSPKAVELIRKNIVLCNFTDQAVVFKRDLSKGLSFLADGLPEAHFSVVFADPPYRGRMAAAILEQLADSDLLSQEALVVIEDDSRADLPEQAGRLNCFDKRRYGDTGFWLYRSELLK